MTWRDAALVCLSLVILGCGRGSPTDSEALPFPSYGERQTAFSDTELLQSVYTSYNAPPDFHSEDGGAYYANTISIEALEDRSDVWIQLATEDSVEARTWCEATNRNSSARRDFVGARSTGRFFETEWRDRGGRGFSCRVHRSAYFVPTADFLSASYSELGIYAVRPVTAEGVEVLAEYLWTIGFGRFGYGRVLSSFVEPVDAGMPIVHRLFVTVPVYGDYGLDDRLTLTEYRVTVEPESGRVEYTEHAVRTIHGHHHRNPAG